MGKVRVRGAVLFVGCATLALSCGSGSDPSSGTPSENSRSSKTGLSSVAPPEGPPATAPLAAAWPATSDCTSPPPGHERFVDDDREAYASDAVLDWDRTTRLPDDGFPISIAPGGSRLADGAVLLEQTASTELRVRRIDGSGTTIWATTLGALAAGKWSAVATTGRTTPKYASPFPTPRLRVDGGKIQVLWPRGTAKKADLVVSELDDRGTVGTATTFATMQSDGWQQALLAPDGSVTTAQRGPDWESAEPLQVTGHRPDGSVGWERNVPTTADSFAGLIQAGDDVWVLAGHHLRRLDPDGNDTLDVSVPTSWEWGHPIEQTLANTPPGGPALLVTVVERGESNVMSYDCVVTIDGKGTAATMAADFDSPVRAWLTPRGLLVVREAGEIMHGESAESLVTYDTSGQLLRSLFLASAGGRSPHEEMTITDIAATVDGGLLIAGTRADLREGVDRRGDELRPGDLIRTPVVVRFDPPAALDLAMVPADSRQSISTDR